MTDAGPPAPASTVDPDLITRIRAGDTEALGTAYFSYAGSLLSLAHRLLADPADAQDLVQDFFVGLPEALTRYEERGQFPAWLSRSLLRLGLMRLRTTRRRRETGLGPAEGVEAPLRGSSDLSRALSRLPDDQRVIVVLKALEGYTHQEIAELLGIRPSASAVRYHRALRRLRSHMEGS